MVNDKLWHTKVCSASLHMRYTIISNNDGNIYKISLTSHNSATAFFALLFFGTFLAPSIIWSFDERC